MAREKRKIRTGKVIGNRMDKTVVVAVEWRQRHPLYKKSLRRVTKFYAHDGDRKCSVGDLVRIEETRPLSRLKRWRILQVLESREIAEITPIELDQQLLADLSEEVAPPEGDEEAASEEVAPPEGDEEAASEEVAPPEGDEEAASEEVAPPEGDEEAASEEVAPPEGDEEAASEEGDLDQKETKE